ncbi:MAG TPA: carbon-nitrogen hydrolase family protein [Planctomycetota bacterium]
MDIRVAQLAVGRDLAANLARILAVLESARPGELVIFPEGMLSGYAPEDDRYAASLDERAIEDGIAETARRAAARRCHCLLGSATRSGGAWRNSVVLLGGPGEAPRYHKAELSGLDRRHFSPGPAAGELFDVGGVPVGVLACREILFPAAWMRLRERGAKLIVHLNNAVQPQDAVWIHVFPTRAMELGLFVCSVNNGAPTQPLPSVLVAPSGREVLRTDLRKDHVLSAAIDLGEVVPDLASRTDF